MVDRQGAVVVSLMLAQAGCGLLNVADPSLQSPVQIRYFGGDSGEGEGEGEGEAGEGEGEGEEDVACDSLVDPVCFHAALACDTDRQICDDPEVFTGNCIAAEYFDNTPREPGSPIVFDVSAWRENPANGYCFFVTLYVVDIEGDLPEDTTIDAEFALESTVVEPVDMDVADPPSFVEENDVAQSGFVDAEACFGPIPDTPVALRVKDAAGHPSNPFCVTPP